MGRLSLVIADGDEAYVESLLEFLSVNYSKRFRINTFTNQASLLKFFESNQDLIDILLISPRLYNDSIANDKIGAIILLTEGIVTGDIKAHGFINKYQHGDRLAGDIINIFSKGNESELPVDHEGKNTRLIAVYSPEGGAGKTSVAVGCCLQYAHRGVNVFYLNLEDIPSTRLYFECKNGPTMSDILYHIKDKSKGLGIKIEGARCIDPESGIHFFTPPDSAREQEELLPAELAGFIEHMRDMRQYDVVFVDMSSSFSSFNRSLIEACDRIIFVTGQGTVSGIKLKALIKELNMLYTNSDTHIFEKLNLVINRYNPDLPVSTDDISISVKSDVITLPYVAGLSEAGKPGHVLSRDSEFNRGISQLVDKLTY